MELSELKELLKDPKKLVSEIKSLAPEIAEEALNVNPEDHKVTKVEHRPKRKVDTTPTGILDASGQMTYNVEYREVHRIPSATEKVIVDWSVNLSLGAGVEIDCKPNNEADTQLLAMVERTLEDNKMDYLRMEIERLRLIYLQVLVIWYYTEVDEYFWSDIADGIEKLKLRCRIFSPEDGSEIVPLRDQFGDMIGVSRFYTVKISGKDVNKMDLIVKEGVITFFESGDGWTEDKKYANLVAKKPVGKAMFILHEGKRRIYQDVESKLDRREEIDSDTADENKQSAFPILVAKGELIAAKGGENANTRKTFQVENNGGLEYVETKGGQEAAKMERENLVRDIYMETNTPYVTIDAISGTGNTPGVAIELMYLPSTNQAKAHQNGPIGMAEQRQLNLLKYALTAINPKVKGSIGLKMKPKYSIALPKNKTEEYENIVKLVTAGLMSKDTAVRKLAFTEDPAAEYDKIKAEAAEAQANALKLAQAKPNPITE